MAECCNIWSKFEAKSLVIKEYTHWSWVLRPSQTTLGASLIIAKQHSEALSGLSAEVFFELGEVIKDVERSTAKAFQYSKINYLALMMVDAHVHFHVIPRYEKFVDFDSIQFKDLDWPSAPKLAAFTPSAQTIERIRAQIKQSI